MGRWQIGYILDPTQRNRGMESGGRGGTRVWNIGPIEVDGAASIGRHGPCFQVHKTETLVAKIVDRQMIARKIKHSPRLVELSQGQWPIRISRYALTRNGADLIVLVKMDDTDAVIEGIGDEKPGSIIAHRQTQRLVKTSRVKTSIPIGGGKLTSRHYG